ncbi:50S ribosomal protein L4 [Patescibacteria group bacterium]
MKADLYTQTGEKKGQVELAKEFFEVPFNADLIHQGLVRQQANSRSPIAHVKQRSDVRGGGRKPFRQKGTGSARQGSRRAPNLKGGGVIFGPRNTRNFEVDMPKKQRRKALFSALSAKAKNNEIFALENYEAKEVKTKPFAEMVKKLPVDRNVLVVIPGKDEMVQKSSANIPNVKTIIVNYLNIADLQKYRKVMFLSESLKKLEEVFGSKKKSEPKKAATPKVKEDKTD